MGITRNHIWNTILGIDFAFVALLLGSGLWLFFSGVELGGEISTGALVSNLILNLLVFGLIPLGWVFYTKGGWEQTKQWLQWGKPEGIIWGVGVGFVALIALGAIIALMQALGLSVESRGNEALADAVDWKLAIFVAAVAGFSEEILFRGVLQNFLGKIPQAILFGLAHASAGSVAAMIATGLLGLGFAYLRPKIGLMGLMVAHFTYNLIIFAISMVYG